MRTEIRRLDRNYCTDRRGMCPNCVAAGKRCPFLSVGSSGRTDRVRCWRCGYEGPRFIEVEVEVRPKRRRGQGVHKVRGEDRHDVRKSRRLG